ncbi:MAG: Holliday junction resolvase RuvX, partial [Candidatus Eisenbacteria bacterium]
MPRILAVDWGERRVGLAMSDPTGTIASSLQTLVVRGESDAVARVVATAQREGVESIVVGLPLLLSGEKGQAAVHAERFAGKLAQLSGLPVQTYDERLTSALAERRMHERGERPGRAKARV